MSLSSLQLLSVVGCVVIASYIRHVLLTSLYPPLPPVAGVCVGAHTLLVLYDSLSSPPVAGVWRGYILIDWTRLLGTWRTLLSTVLGVER